MEEDKNIMKDIVEAIDNLKYSLEYFTDVFKLANNITDEDVDNYRGERVLCE